jgi:hypothetical protein
MEFWLFKYTDLFIKRQFGMHPAETYDELIANIHEAVEGCLSIDVEEFEQDANSKILELAI